MSKPSEDEAIPNVDKLNKDNAIEEAHKLISKYEDSTNPQLLWRLARSCRYMAQRTNDAGAKKTLTNNIRDYAARGLDLDNNNAACHKWYAIGLNLVGDIEGVKEKLKNAYTIKEHFQKAKELDGSDPMPCYLLGMWCFSCADMSWFTRKVAATIFGEPPTSTYDEAIENFEAAEKVEPNFYSKNQMMLGKTYSRLKNKEKAKEWLEKTLEYPGKRFDDEEAKKEAKELLKSL